MGVFIFIRILILFLSYRSNNPFVSAFSLLLSFMLVSPFLSFFTPSWYLYMLVIIFSRGVFVAVVYLCSLGRWSFKKTGFSFIMFILYVIFFPIVIPSKLFSIPIVENFQREFLIPVSFFVGFLGFLLVFLSFILHYRAAIRKF